MRLLLGVVFCVCVCVRVCVSVSSSTGPIPEQDGVLQLNKGNFNRALRQHSQLLVHFLSPLSGEGQRVAAEFRRAAEQLKRSEVRLGVVDVSTETELAKELNGMAPPTIRLYQSGDRHNPVPCPGLHSSSSIVTWLKRRAGPSADLIIDLAQLERLAASEGLLVLGLFKDLQQGSSVFSEASVDLPDLPFAVSSSPDVYRKYDIISGDAILLLRQSELLQVYEVNSQTSKEELITFITVHQMDLVTEYNGQTAGQILSSPVLSHALLFVNKSSEDFLSLRSYFTSAAATFRGKVLFVLVDVEETRNGRMLEYFRVRDFEAPLVRLVNLTDHVTYHLPSETLDTHTITHFCHTYLEGKAKPKLQSEPVPAQWDQRRVKELVGLNLEEVAFNPDLTVFIMLYLPYSQSSQALFPVWEELAEAFLSRQEVVIARIDASANDISLSVQGACPQLLLCPALHTERVLVYSGGRTLEELLQFVDREMLRAERDRVKEEDERRTYIAAQKAADTKKKEKKEEL